MVEQCAASGNDGFISTLDEGDEASLGKVQFPDLASDPCSTSGLGLQHEGEIPIITQQDFPDGGIVPGLRPVGFEVFLVHAPRQFRQEAQVLGRIFAWTDQEEDGFDGLRLLLVTEG